ncbi:NXPE family member 2-like [Conger conger]|uniref:NXPE family member 2-like n=1 Tax=Conger conger TaxID=82655 RepID=UPI002A5A7A1A|nr:NXPE family member 2-like [Conger conger]XP_061109801.1 NXPE family member 2-like [Conger conger]XP_061109803.1 NXPE family member 2-like [Conger conger]
MRSGNGPIPNMTKDEYHLLSQKNTGIAMRNSFASVKVVNCPAGAHRPTEKCMVGFGMKSPLPTGYFFKNRWSSSSCQTGSLFSADAISRCLKDKKLKLMGDSTVRQWQETLMNTLKGLKYVKPYDTHYFAVAVDPEKNITVQWKMHGHPSVTGYQVVKELCGYISEEVDRVAVGDVVVIGVGQHFRPFPLEIFIQRLINMWKAILRLQERSPQTLVVIKLENTREFSSTMTHLSDWFGYVQNLAQRKVFRDLKVVLVDAWDITTAANTFAIHPNTIVVSNEISLALSHLCHDA